MEVRGMGVKVSNAMGRGTEALPIRWILLKLREMVLHLLPPFGDVAVIEMITRIVGGDIGVQPETFALNPGERIGRHNVAQRFVENGIVHSGRKTGVELTPKRALHEVVI